jgi:integrase
MYEYKNQDLMKLFDCIDSYYCSMPRDNYYFLERDKMIIKFAYYLGLRRREIAFSQVKFIDFEKKLISVPVIYSKNKTNRIIPIPDILFSSIVYYVKKFRIRDYLFLSSIGKKRKPLLPLSVGNRFRFFRDKSGINFIRDHASDGKNLSLYRLHDLRGTYATSLDKAGVRLKVIQNLLGHKHLFSTERYLGDSTLAERAFAVNHVFSENIF